MQTRFNSLKEANRAGLLYTRGEDAWRKGRLRDAFGLYLKAAQSGAASAYVFVGQFYDQGQGVKRDESKALQWYRRAYVNYADGNAGRAFAAANSGCIYRDRGKSELALLWFRRAVRLGDGDANLEIAKIYASKADLVRTRVYLNRALRSKWATDKSKDEARILLVSLRGHPRNRPKAKQRNAELRSSRAPN